MSLLGVAVESLLIGATFLVAGLLLFAAPGPRAIGSSARARARDTAEVTAVERDVPNAATRVVARNASRNAFPWGSVPWKEAIPRDFQ